VAGIRIGASEGLLGKGGGSRGSIGERGAEAADGPRRSGHREIVGGENGVERRRVFAGGMRRSC